MYRHDMSEESKKVFLPAGWRDFRIVACIEHTSKAGNEGFKFNWFDIALGEEVEIYATAVKKKRWFLKSILSACNVEAAQDGIYEWEISDVLQKVIKGRVEHYEDEWINQDNVKVKTPKWKIAEVRSMMDKVETAIDKGEEEPFK